MDTRLFAQQYANWKFHAPEIKKWGDFEPFWSTALDLWHKTKRTTAQAGYIGHVNKEDNKQVYEQAEKTYYESLQHFGEANCKMLQHSAPSQEPMWKWQITLQQQYRPPETNGTNGNGSQFNQQQATSTRISESKYTNTNTSTTNPPNIS